MSISPYDFMELKQEKGTSDSRGYSNTPAQRTSQEIVKHRPLNILIDYIGITFSLDIYSVDVVFSLLYEAFGIDRTSFVEGRKNYEGYADSFTFENINIYYNGAPEQGIHIDFTGQACRFCELQFEKLGVQDYNWYEFLGYMYDLEGVKFTRLDIACDDLLGSYFKVPDLFEKVLKGEVTSKFKSWHPDGHWNMNGEPNGITLYFGSNHSKINIVFYEKGKQLKLPNDWTRTELRLYKERATAFIHNMVTLKDTDIGVLFAGVVKDYITFRDKKETDSNKRRWNTSDFWEEFLHNVPRLRLGHEKPDRSISKTRDWIDHQVSRSLARMYFAYQGLDDNWLHEILKEGFQRLNDTDKKQIEEYRRLYEEENRLEMDIFTQTNYRDKKKTASYEDNQQSSENKFDFKI